MDYPMKTFAALLTVVIPVLSAQADDKNGIVAPMFYPVEIDATKAIEATRRVAHPLVDHSKIVGRTMIVGPTMRPPEDAAAGRNEQEDENQKVTSSRKLGK